MTLARLLAHLRWADDRTEVALASIPGDRSEALRLYAHILGAEAVWIARIEGADAVSPWPVIDRDECHALSVRNHQALERWSTDDPAPLDRTIHYVNSRGDAFDSTVGDILHHVVLHGMYHRGQIMLLVRAAGGTPLATDFIAYVREVEPGPP